MTLRAYLITLRGRIREALCPELQVLRDRLAHEARDNDQLYQRLSQAMAERDALQQIVADYPPIEVELREVSDRAFKAEAEVEALRALLLRIRAWDMMDTATDGAFWRREIDAALKGASDADD